ncbi:hypothetical protein CYMTET_29407 [Cymbomonas tetramitiformis]|uniref:NPHP4 Ig-like domain-containing protein n=1 Tax=Cymbomonas tetramitiformis TaxID=36881 RepID=A0AAE0FL33_9CHLO|nr:hypothetical protein CYMTET_29407 [Cymbomonas tetramitiformis]
MGAITCATTTQAGLPCYKKISYTNQYSTPRSFYLRSTHPWLLAFQPERLDIAENATARVGLSFEVADRQVTKFANYMEVLVFINDEEDKNEECFRIRVHFS